MRCTTQSHYRYAHIRFPSYGEMMVDNDRKRSTSSPQTHGTSIVQHVPVSNLSASATRLASNYCCFSEDISVRVFDLFEEDQGGIICRSQEHTTALSLEAALRDTPGHIRCRIISIHSVRTIEPLQITPDLMQTIFDHYAVPVEFESVVASFGDEPLSAEGGCSNIHIQATGEEGELKLAYQVRYVEMNRRGGLNPWSLRHTGIYHHWQKQSSLFIILQPVPESMLEARLLQLDIERAQASPDVRSICEDPFQLHAMLAACYQDNWRWYLRDLGVRFDEKNDIALTLRPDMAVKDRVSFKCVQGLRNIQDKLLTARACCNGNLRVADEILTLQYPQPAKGAIQFQASQLRGYLASTDVLQDRVRNTIDFIGYTLNMHTQIEATEIHNQLRDMTQQLRDMTEHSVDDSTTVKVITFLSAFYLPGSFVATLFGMNFFDFGGEHISMTKDFYIFILAWLPLTIATWGIYLLIVGLDAKKKQKQAASSNQELAEKRTYTSSTFNTQSNHT